MSQTPSFLGTNAAPEFAAVPSIERDRPHVLGIPDQPDAEHRRFSPSLGIPAHQGETAALSSAVAIGQPFALFHYFGISVRGGSSRALHGSPSIPVGTEHHQEGGLSFRHSGAS